jgi:hypothetical protein
MSISAIEIYREVLPRTNCGDCGYPTCFAFATLVVVEKIPLNKCPHIDNTLSENYQEKLDLQHASGKWVKKDIAAEALEWAKERSASMNIVDLPARIGGKLVEYCDILTLELPYFNGSILIREGDITRKDGKPLNRWEQVFLYNHMAQGGTRQPTGIWKGLEEIPNTISKIKSMKNHIEDPIIDRYRGKAHELFENAALHGGVPFKGNNPAEVAILFTPLPMIPVLLLFWDEDKAEGFEPRARLLFDETIAEHLDIESIMFLSERIRQLLCNEEE